MLSMCRNDQEAELEQLLEEGDCSVTFTDGIGNSAAHYAAKTGSIGCLEVLVNDDEVDLDIQNTLEGDTPLHFAVKHASEDHEMAKAMVELLIAGGANINIANRDKLTPIMLVSPKHQDIKKLLEEANTTSYLDDNDIAHDEVVGDEYDSDEGSD
ncbi:unnamed protein product [Mucor hiemalis]